MSTATVTSKGQLTLPKSIRETLGLSAGDKVNFVLMKDGNYAILPASHSVKTLEGFFHQPGRKPVSLDDMDKAIAAEPLARDWSRYECAGPLSGRR